MEFGLWKPPCQASQPDHSYNRSQATKSHILTSQKPNRNQSQATKSNIVMSKSGCRSQSQRHGQNDPGGPGP